MHDFAALQLTHSPATLTSLVKVRRVHAIANRSGQMYSKGRTPYTADMVVVSLRKVHIMQQIAPPAIWTFCTLLRSHPVVMQAYGAMNEVEEAVTLLRTAGTWVDAASRMPVAQPPAYGAGLVAAARVGDAHAVADIEASAAVVSSGK